MDDSLFEYAKNFLDSVNNNNQLKNNLADQMIKDESLSFLDMEKIYEEAEMQEKPLRECLAKAYCKDKSVKQGFLEEISSSTYRISKIASEILSTTYK